jgi:hypothetical protein
MTWIGLTAKEREDIHEMWVYNDTLHDEQDVVDLVEKLLKEKNEQKNCTGHRDEHGSRYDPFVRNSGH